MKIAHLVAAAALVLAGCGGEQAAKEEPKGEAGSKTANDTDIQFLSEMIPHHAGAVSMVDLTRRRDLDPEVAQLVEKIREDQTNEIELMSNELERLGVPVPATGRDHVHGGHGTPMNLRPLKRASDAKFQDLWLEMMIEHHEGAIEAADAELAGGELAFALDLAEQIKTAQQDEIDLMRDLLEQ